MSGAGVERLLVASASLGWLGLELRAAARCTGTVTSASTVLYVTVTADPERRRGCLDQHDAHIRPKRGNRGLGRRVAPWKKPDPPEYPDAHPGRPPPSAKEHEKSAAVRLLERTAGERLPAESRFTMVGLTSRFA
jgi:hypothetical protein